MKKSYGLVRMNVNAEGYCCMSISELTNMKFLSTATNENWMLIKFFLIGDIKGLFQLAGVNRCDSKYCLFCKCRPADWKNT